MKYHLYYWKYKYKYNIYTSLTIKLSSADDPISACMLIQHSLFPSSPSILHFSDTCFTTNLSMHADSQSRGLFLLFVNLVHQNAIPVQHFLLCNQETPNPRLALIFNN
ncbi:hypothetical protein PIB30_007812 [Stylosanthes scabra]|uniref:Uncharacterized protein n=1 Tax=Stylosanthes scabra TaxID=79078 RepID=A0ABU6Q5U6_9FABA|nr:hypothetical protein [Stylosanthes scabra]